MEKKKENIKMAAFIRNNFLSVYHKGPKTAYFI